ncbi:hypothetical protein ERHA54_09100 [Erwinia rhapontici]|uniref:Uncharacterized protein n=1 Tax=Erwinia rhapontici TaxID=55212 RepID=A0ABN6DJA9_ERWRD|nr:hypothetical protein ERHA53_08680 [Erwinia rhapontici]BCQ38307.1 hypothetical protein ERHA54_09100 [Erwinia rhapontici]
MPHRYEGRACPTPTQFTLWVGYASSLHGSPQGSGMPGPYAVYLEGRACLILIQFPVGVGHARPFFIPPEKIPNL